MRIQLCFLRNLYYQLGMTDGSKKLQPMSLSHCCYGENDSQKCESVRMKALYQICLREQSKA